MINTADFALPKPGHAAGARILSGYAYSKLKREKLRQQGGCCALCPRRIDSPGEGHLHHESRTSYTAASGQSHGRGMNGGKRNDCETVVICCECHAGEEEAKRGGKKSVQKVGFIETQGQREAEGSQGDCGERERSVG